MQSPPAASGHSSLAQQRASWLSLFAILMMFIGPLVSQSMPMEAGRSMPMSMDHDMSMGMPMDMPDHDHSLHPLWEKCGYCSLFFHTPALPQAPVFVAAATPAPITGLAMATTRGHARQNIFPGARTRAPPADRHA